MDGVPVPNSDNSFFQPQQTGCYTVFSWWSFSEACGSFALDTVCVAFAGINEQALTDADVHISPNPSSGTTLISFNKEQKNTTVKIKDAPGKEIQHLDCNGKELSIDLSGKASGVYFIELTDKNGSRITKRIIVQ
jgi:hypothetical protein